MVGRFYFVICRKVEGVTATYFYCIYLRVLILCGGRTMLEGSDRYSIARIGA